MKKKSRLILTILASLTLLAACGSNNTTKKKETEQSTKTEKSTDSSKQETKPSKDGKTTTIKTKNGTYEVALPSDWKKLDDPTELNDDADFGLENEDDDAYTAVLAESKKDFDNFDAFKKLIDFENFGAIKEDKKEEINLKNIKGERHLLTISLDGMVLYYIYDLVETKDYYLQVISWTTKSHQEKLEPTLIKINDSIKQVAK